MCNDYEQHIARAEYCRMMQSPALDIPSHQTDLDLSMADDIRINDPAPIMRAAGDMIELTRMTFAFPPSGPKGGPIFNFRSEGRNLGNSKALPQATHIHNADDGAGTRRCTHPQSADCGAASGGLGGLNTPYKTETELLKALPAGSLASKPYEKEADKAQPDPAPEVFIG